GVVRGGALPGPTLVVAVVLKYSRLIESGGKYWFPSTTSVLLLSASTAPFQMAFTLRPTIIRDGGFRDSRGARPPRAKNGAAGRPKHPGGLIERRARRNDVVEQHRMRRNFRPRPKCEPPPG